MQKFFSSAIYEIKNEMYGGRKPYRNNKRHNHHQNYQGRPQTTGGRGGKPMSSSERKNSKEPRNKSQNKDKLPFGAQAASGQQQQPQFVQVPLPNAQAVSALRQIDANDIEQRKQAIGNMIYPCI